MKNRLDILMVENKLVTGREKAKELIKSGQVYVNGKQVLKPAQECNDVDKIEIIGETLKYVGRGGLKLEKALQYFNVKLTNKICADIGASTGGFTDCMLLNGAKKVFAVDVGHGQLAQKLIDDVRVVNLEGLNVRSLTTEVIPCMLDFISVDVSFISLSLVLPHLVSFLSDKGQIVTLIKPQFEAGKENIGKKGIVKSQKIHLEVLKNFVSLVTSLGLYVNNLTFSPVKGGNGNIEYLAILSKNNYTVNNVNSEYIKGVFNSLSEN